MAMDLPIHSTSCGLGNFPVIESPNIPRHALKTSKLWTTPTPTP